MVVDIRDHHRLARPVSSTCVVVRARKVPREPTIEGASMLMARSFSCGRQ